MYPYLDPRIAEFMALAAASSGEGYGGGAYPQPQPQPQHHATVGSGLEIYGTGYGAPDLQSMMAGAEIYGGPAYGAAPSRASYPAWLQQRALGPIYGAMAYGADAPMPVANPAPGVARQVDVRMVPPQNIRRFPLGFGPEDVTAGNTASITTRPQVVFRPEKLVIPSDIGGFFRINDIKVGKDSQFVATNSLPGRAFDEKSTDNLLSFHGAAISQDITVVAQSTSGVTQTFEAYMSGTAAE